MESKNGKSLYDRLGRVEGISTIVDDIVEYHMSNPAVNARFLPLKDNPEHFAEVRQHLINFFAAGSGGPEEYTGKDMLSSHKGMNISQGEYMHARLCQNPLLKPLQDKRSMSYHQTMFPVADYELHNNQPCQ